MFIDLFVNKIANMLADKAIIDPIGHGSRIGSKCLPMQR